MKNKYILWAKNVRPECRDDCPAVVEKAGKFIIVGDMLGSDAVRDLKKNANVGVGPGEVALEIDVELVMQAIEKRIAATV